MWQIQRDGYILAMRTTTDQGILREIQKNFIRDAEKRKTRNSEIGLKIGGKWKAIQKIQSREIYEELKRKRYGKRKEDEMKTNHAENNDKENADAERKTILVEGSVQTDPTKQEKKQMAKNEEWRKVR